MTSGVESNEASSAFVARKLSSTLAPGTDARRESNISINPSSGGDMSSSSSDDDGSVGAFDKRGHQGSYVLRKVTLFSISINCL